MFNGCYHNNIFYNNFIFIIFLLLLFRDQQSQNINEELQKAFAPYTISETDSIRNYKVVIKQDCKTPITRKVIAKRRIDSPDDVKIVRREGKIL